jgi:regulator of protease activity HflC (stomatin/prohibitin superfamily)
VISLGKIGEDVKNETIVVNQYPFTGNMEYWTSPGFHWQCWGKTTTYYKTQQLWFGSDSEAGDQQGKPIPVIFNDASDGMIYGSLRVKLPTDPKYLARIHTDYNGMDRLMNDLVRPTVTKVIYASGPLMSAFESYAEKKNDLIEYITDQLNNGVYKTAIKRSEVLDAITGEKKVINVATLIPDSLAAGGYKRSESSPFAYYGLEIGQVAVSKIAYSDKVNRQIAQQQEANMLIQTSRAKSAAAAQEAIRAEEEGKALAMKAKWEQEKIKAVEVTKAEQEYEVARLSALKAKEDAKRIEAQGMAEAAAARAKVLAGLDPLQRATIDKETTIGVAQALANSNVRWVPEVMIIGGKEGASANPMDAVGLNMLLDIAKKQGKNN